MLKVLQVYCQRNVSIGQHGDRNAPRKPSLTLKPNASKLAAMLCLAVGEKAERSVCTAEPSPLAAKRSRDYLAIGAVNQSM